jgi:hypothetical protein
LGVVAEAETVIETTKAVAHRGRVPSAVGWSGQPATGRSFGTMMVLVVVATGVALFLALHHSTERGHREAPANVLRHRRTVP